MPKYVNWKRKKGNERKRREEKRRMKYSDTKANRNANLLSNHNINKNIPQ